MAYVGRSFRRKRSYRRSMRRTAKSRKLAIKPSPIFTKKVKKILSDRVETKQACVIFPLTGFNSGINSSADICAVIPNITQGIQDNNRLGDQVTLQKLTIKGHMILTQGNSLSVANARIGVRIMMVQPKAYSNIDAIVANSSTWQNALLKKGGTTSAFTGATAADLYAPLNTDVVTKYYDKIVYLSMPYYNVATSVGLVTQDLRQSTRFFSIVKKLRGKKVLYDSAFTTGAQPVNFCPVIVLGYVHLDGSAADVASTTVSLAFDSFLDFEDP